MNINRWNCVITNSTFQGETCARNLSPFNACNAMSISMISKMCASRTKSTSVASLKDHTNHEEIH